MGKSGKFALDFSMPYNFTSLTWKKASQNSDPIPS